jgi:hypothetical protein
MDQELRLHIDLEAAKLMREQGHTARALRLER